MSNVQIYTTPFCPFCYRAKKLLGDKGVEFEEIDVMMSPAKRKEMAERAGARSVPQIFVNGKHLSDCDGLYELEEDGELDERLGLA